MLKQPKPNISELMAAGKPIDEALARGVKEALLRHKRLGESIVVWQDGKPVILSADQIPITEADLQKP